MRCVFLLFRCLWGPAGVRQLFDVCVKLSQTTCAANLHPRHHLLLSIETAGSCRLYSRPSLWVRLAELFWKFMISHVWPASNDKQTPGANAESSAPVPLPIASTVWSALLIIPVPSKLTLSWHGWRARTFGHRKRLLHLAPLSVVCSSKEHEVIDTTLLSAAATRMGKGLHLFLQLFWSLTWLQVERVWKKLSRTRLWAVQLNLCQQVESFQSHPIQLSSC